MGEITTLAPGGGWFRIHGAIIAVSRSWHRTLEDVGSVIEV